MRYYAVETQYCAIHSLTVVSEIMHRYPFIQNDPLPARLHSDDSSHELLETEQPLSSSVQQFWVFALPVSLDLRASATETYEGESRKPLSDVGVFLAVELA